MSKNKNNNPNKFKPGTNVSEDTPIVSSVVQHINEEVFTNLNDLFVGAVVSRMFDWGNHSSDMAHLAGLSVLAATHDPTEPEGRILHKMNIGYAKYLAVEVVREFLDRQELTDGSTENKHVIDAVTQAAVDETTKRFNHLVGNFQELDEAAAREAARQSLPPSTPPTNSTGKPSATNAVIVTPPTTPSPNDKVKCDICGCQVAFSKTSVFTSKLADSPEAANDGKRMCSACLNKNITGEKKSVEATLAALKKEQQDFGDKIMAFDHMDEMGLLTPEQKTKRAEFQAAYDAATADINQLSK